MKKIQVIALSALTLCFASCKDETKTMTDTTVMTDTIVSEVPETPEVPMDSIAVQKAWEAYMTPGEAHKAMAAEEGSWINEMTFWMAPGAEPHKATSTAEIKMIFGGRYQQTNYTGDMMGMPFEGMALVAYDNTTKEMTSTWIDNMGTGMMVLKGKYDDATKSSNLSGSMVDPVTGKEKQVREVYSFVDDNTRKMEMFEIPEGGEEFKTMEIVMTRN